MQKNPSDLARIHIRVKGRVQGVGFRAFVAANAQAIGVDGWVRNVGWNEVETVAEAARAVLEHFLAVVSAGPRSSLVEDAHVDWETPTGEFSTFEIRHSF
jgi:acylphosphatase